MRTEGLLSHGVSQVEKWVLVLGEAKMIFSFASQEKNVHPLPGLFGCFVPPGRGFILILLSHPAGILFEFIYSIRELKKYEQSCEHNVVMIHVFFL